MNEQWLDTVPTFQVMIKHKNIMMDAIREMDKRGEPFVREHSFYSLVHHVMTNFVADNAKQTQLSVAFRRENLKQAHILADYDEFEGEGRLYFDKAVIDIFRLFDKSLFQELTDIELKTKLLTLRELMERFDSGSLLFSKNDIDYKETLDTLLRALADLQSLIRRNIIRMENINRELSESSEGVIKARSKEEGRFFQKENIAQLSKLLSRHIVPTRQFLDEKVVLVDGLNLLSCLKKLKSMFDRHDAHSEASTILRYAITFNSYHKEISRVSISIDQYLARSQKRLLQFNAIETAFDELLIGLKETKADVRKKHISTGFSAECDLFSGIKHQRKPRELRLSDSASYLNNVITDIEARIEDKKIFQQLDLSILESSKDESFEDRMIRVEKIREFIFSLKMSEYSDLTKALHQRLSAYLSSYHVIDLLEALSLLLNSEQLEIDGHNYKITNYFGYILLGDYGYQYRKICTTKVINNEYN